MVMSVKIFKKKANAKPMRNRLGFTSGVIFFGKENFLGVPREAFFLA